MVGNGRPRERPASRRVLHVLETLNPSGAERLLEALGPLAVADGISVEILSTGEQGPGPFANRLARAGYQIRHLPFRKSPGYFLSLWRLLRRGRYDVVHIHPERAFFWTALTARLSGAARLIRTVHTIFPFEGALRRRRTIQRRIAQRILGVTFTALSPQVVANEAERFGNAAMLMSAHLDTAAFRPADEDERRQARTRLGLGHGVFAVGSLGACDPVKNHQGLIRAIGRLRDAGHDVVLLHGGTGEEETQERALAASLRLDGAVRFLGRIEDVPGFLGALDAFAMPSHREGLGVAALEALGCAVPSVLARGTGMDALDMFGTAIVWCDPNPASIADALSELVNDPAGHRASRTAHCAAVAAERFRPGSAWAVLARLYGFTPAERDSLRARS